MSHIADIAVEDGITIHLNSTAGRVEISGSRPVPGQPAALGVIAFASLTVDQLRLLGETCLAAARAVASEPQPWDGGDPTKFSPEVAEEFEHDLRAAGVSLQSDEQAAVVAKVGAIAAKKGKAS